VFDECADGVNGECGYGGRLVVKTAGVELHHGDGAAVVLVGE
jgi:hypothetical protein